LRGTRRSLSELRQEHEVGRKKNIGKETRRALKKKRKYDSARSEMNIE
jgi:hypothetical protein